MVVKCKCGADFENVGKYGIRKFCSRKCANSRGPRTEETKRKQSMSLVGRNVGGKLANPLLKEKRKCLGCDSKFECYKKASKRWCSLKCSKKLSGGYREGSGNGKSGWYKGIFCNSSYELAWVVYRLDHGFEVKRFSGYLTNGVLKYYPDFIVGDKHIVEIKGYHRKEVDEKTELAKSLGYVIDVLYKTDLRECFDWIQTKYHTKNVISLYDNRKPKFSYRCHFCGKDIYREQRLKGKVAFCSRVCAGKGILNRKNVGPT